jgi:phosphoribosyl 1,2-cyclic phosphate phosphodiesterase
MKIKILGSGPSVGVPIALNIWQNKNIDKKESKNYRMRSSFYLADGEEKKILVECGPDFRTQMIQYGIGVDDFDDIFLSHSHHDHISGIWELENIHKYSGKIKNIYCGQEVLCELKKRLSWLFKHKDGLKCMKINLIKPYKTYNDMFILEAKHGKLQSLGFRYKDFIFTADLNILPEKTKQYMKNASLWLLQCNNLNESEYSLKYHTHLAMALDLINELQPKRAILTHLMDEIDYNEVSKILPPNVQLAFDGMEIEI